MHWGDMQTRFPQLAQLAHDRLIGPGVLLVATIRADGTPRISPVEPFILDGQLWLSMMWRSRKALDLIRDDRVLLHSIVSSRDGAEGELKLRGTAVVEHETATRRRYCEAVAVLGWRPEEPLFHLFRTEIDDVTYVRYSPNGDQHVVRWPPPLEFVRRSTSATSVGPAEPAHDLLTE
jgi:hypothetical protein